MATWPKGIMSMKEVHAILNSRGITDVARVSKCLKAGILHGNIKLLKPEEDPKNEFGLDQVCYSYTVMYAPGSGVAWCCIFLVHLIDHSDPTLTRQAVSQISSHSVLYSLNSVVPLLAVHPPWLANWRTIL